MTRVEYQKDRMALICTHCESGSSPVLLVAHTVSDGVYQFLCGADGHNVEDADPIHLYHVVEMDPTIEPLLEYNVNFEAERASVDCDWVIDWEPDLD